MTYFVPGTASQPTAELELTISCRGLIGKDYLSKSDPMCVTFIQPFGEERWVEYHRTECVPNCHDPDFTSKVNILYRFEEQQNLKFEIYDIDSDNPKLEYHDFLGQSVCSLGQIIANGQLKLQLSQSKRPTSGDQQCGYILILAEELFSLRDQAIFQFSGHKLDKKSWFFNPDPFLTIYKSNESGSYSVVHKTEIVKRKVNPRWKKFTIPVKTLCNGDYDRSLKLEVSTSGHLIGECFVTLKELNDCNTGSATFTLNNPSKQSKRSDYKNSGEIKLEYFEIKHLYSFMDYIKGGTQLHCSIAIDFTGSNGNPLAPDSLHYISNQPNSYEQAIKAVGSIIQDYDSDKQFPVLGFGARLPPDGVVSHEFFVNMNPSNPYCNGIGGVLEAYRACIRQVQLYGPTNFSPVIRHVSKFASAYRDGSSYFILLILTDGVITDMPQTVQAIVESSVLPLSIIIVGIGSADFSAMETLDADTVALQWKGVKAQRDIVQFVPYNQFLSVGDPRTARIRLAREVLAEIPKQFLSYMTVNNIVPKPPNTNIQFLPPDPEQPTEDDNSVVEIRV